MLHQLIKPAIVIFAIAIPLWLIFRLVVAGYRKQPVHPGREFLFFTFYLYIIFVLIATIVPIPFTQRPRTNLDRVNLVPLIHTVRQFMSAFSYNRSFIRSAVMVNVLGNLALFFPLGILLPLVSARFRRFGKLIMLAFVFSAMIEFTQHVSQYFGNYRSADIDDIIFNTLGAALGFAMAGKWLSERSSIKNASHLPG